MQRKKVFLYWRRTENMYSTWHQHLHLKHEILLRKFIKIYSVLVSEHLHAFYIFGDNCFIRSVSLSLFYSVLFPHWGIINLSLHLHPTLHALPLPVLSRRLNDNEISSLDAMGAFKKLPNLRKMCVDVHFSIFTLRDGVWGGGLSFGTSGCAFYVNNLMRYEPRRRRR